MSFWKLQFKKQKVTNLKKVIIKTAMEKVRGINELASVGTNLFTLGGQLVSFLEGFVA